MAALIDSNRRGVPTGREEIAQLGRNCGAVANTSLPSSTHHVSNEPTEAIIGLLEALRRNVLGFRDLTQYR